MVWAKVRSKDYGEIEDNGVRWKKVGLDGKEWGWMEENWMRWKIMGLYGREWGWMEESGVGRKREVGLQRAKNSLLCVVGEGDQMGRKLARWWG